MNHGITHIVCIMYEANNTWKACCCVSQTRQRQAINNFPVTSLHRRQLALHLAHSECISMMLFTLYNLLLCLPFDTAAGNK